jgi:hypothetical protein
VSWSKLVPGCGTWESTVGSQNSRMSPIEVEAKHFQRPRVISLAKRSTSKTIPTDELRFEDLRWFYSLWSSQAIKLVKYLGILRSVQYSSSRISGPP